MHVLSFFRKFSELLVGPVTEDISFTGSRAVVAGISSRREVNILFLGEISVVFVGEIVFDCFIFAANTYGEAFVVVLGFLRKFSELLVGPGTENISFTTSRAVVAGISSRREVNILFFGEILVVFVGEIVFDCFIFAANTYGKAFVVLIASRVEHFEGEDTGKIANFFSGTNIHFIVQYSDKVQ